MENEGEKNDNPGATPGRNGDQGSHGITAIPDNSTGEFKYSGDNERIRSLKFKNTVPQQEHPEDEILSDSPDGPCNDIRSPKDSDIIVIQVTDYGCEVVEVDSLCDEKYKITRFIHLLVDVFLKNAWKLQFFDLLRQVNLRSQQSVAKCKVTGRRLLYFFPGK